MPFCPSRASATATGLTHGFRLSARSSADCSQLWFITSFTRTPARRMCCESMLERLDFPDRNMDTYAWSNHQSRPSSLLHKSSQVNGAEALLFSDWPPIFPAPSASGRKQPEKVSLFSFAFCSFCSFCQKLSVQRAYFVCKSAGKG